VSVEEYLNFVSLLAAEFLPKILRSEERTEMKASNTTHILRCDENRLIDGA
jgi:hypothetical protein